MENHLGLAVAAYRFLERADDQVGPLGIVDAVSDHVPGVIVEEDQGEGRRPVDVPLQEVEVPHYAQLRIVWLMRSTALCAAPVGVETPRAA